MSSASVDPVRISRALRCRLPDSIADTVDALVDAAAAAKTALYVTGGSVRDVILDRLLIDLDLVVEGDAEALLRAALPRTRVTAHARFGTATAVVAGVRIDLATARSETYARPGALPATRPTTVAADLLRRDFACNAVAVRLGSRPALLDPAGGLADIAAMHIRVLHERSFTDDPTRIFRAFRYAARLDFTVEPLTASLLTSSLPCIAEVGGERLRRELELMLSDAPPGAALEAAHTAGALQVLHPALHWSRAKSESYAAASLLSPKERPAYGFALMASGASEQQAQAIARRLRLKRDEAAAVTAVASLRSASELLRRLDVKPSGAVVLLDRYPAPAIAAYARTTGNTIARDIMFRYLGEWRTTRPMLSGRDLIEMGVPAGPQVQRGLQLVRAARLDGWARDRDDERALVLRFARSIRDSSTMHADVEFDPGGE
ncbi:MAG: CCA tRNA nucleotidyltransferase [Dehalococcoidia bacterium]|nr:CCA tRNA nucleotidyltransferase [Dehalococcoidia bacterium]